MRSLRDLGRDGIVAELLSFHIMSLGDGNMLLGALMVRVAILEVSLGVEVGELSSGC